MHYFVYTTTITNLTQIACQRPSR